MSHGDSETSGKSSGEDEVEGAEGNDDLSFQRAPASVSVSVSLSGSTDGRTDDVSTLS